MTRINQEMRWIFFLLLTIYFVCHTLYASQSGIKPGSKARIVQDETGWVDSVMQTMTTDEKIGQLFMIRAFSNKGSDHTRAIKELIKTYKIGGLCFFQGSAEEQIKLTNEYQQLSKIPLMVSMDAEWGPAMRLKQDFIDFPRQMTMGAIRDNRLIFQFGKEVARELLRMGVQIDFAPSIDINNNAANPVIGSRSFGENKYLVAQKGYMYMLGLQSAGVMACAKHFPGHGDTNVDSHFDVPVLPFDSVRLESLEMYPFKVLINQGVQSVMIGHLAVPGIDHDPKLPASLSHRIITHWLKDKLQFDGLIFTDALEMQGVTKNFEPGDIEVKAIQAGVDVLLLPSSITSGVKAIRNAVKEGDITIARLDESVRKILVAKYRFGLTATPQVATAGLEKELITGEGKALKQKIIEEAITMVKNENMMIPVQDITQDIATLALGYTKKAPFQERVDSYCKAHHFFIGAATKDKTNIEMMNSLAEHKMVIIGVLGMNSSAKDNYNISSNNLDFINQLSQKTKVILIAFGSPYSLKNFITPAAVLCAYGDDPVYQSAAYFSQLFHDKKIEKEYLALIEGSQFTGSGELQHFISPKISAGNKSRIIEDTEMEHNAETSFTILGNTDKYSIILLKPHTGRHHQLRAQLAATMSPIKGDVKYGARRGNKDRSIYLHAYRIRFPHPVSGEEMIYVAPPPKDVLWDLTSPLIEIIN